MSLPDPTILPAKNEFQLHLGKYQPIFEQTLQTLKEKDIVNRIWAKDHTVWRDDPTEISNRLGWLHIAGNIRSHLHTIEQFTQQVKNDGYTDVLLLGMGGSSLAPELFSHIFDGKGLNLAILDSTDAGAVRSYTNSLNPATTLFIVATKSGGTVETLSFFKYFYNWTANALGTDAAGSHFVAITDPHSKLEQLAQEYKFRTTFLNDPNIGGRYSVLSHFGLVPANLVGINFRELLNRAERMADNNKLPHDNMGLQLGTVMGTLAKEGIDKLTLITSPDLTNLGDWIEQLVAESTGKDGKGILPIVGESIGSPASYEQDRLFVYIQEGQDNTHTQLLKVLCEAKVPIVHIQLQDTLDIGGQFFLWEFATAIAGSILDIHPFDQPNVEAAKVSARKMVTAYQKTGKLPAGDIASPDTLINFLTQAKPHDYIAIQAYVTPTPETTQTLNALRLALGQRTNLATTMNYGPRFLHSTGQLHKGDSGNGLFIQITTNASEDTPIPNTAGKSDSDITFNILKLAQALGDYEALQTVNPPRRVIRFHFDAEQLNYEINKLTMQVSNDHHN